jgi:hypothetical protein
MPVYLVVCAEYVSVSANVRAPAAAAAVDENAETTAACSPLACAQDYMDPNIPTKGFFTNVRYMFDLRDVVVDVQGRHARWGGRTSTTCCWCC